MELGDNIKILVKDSIGDLLFDSINKSCKISFEIKYRTSISYPKAYKILWRGLRHIIENLKETQWN